MEMERMPAAGVYGVHLEDEARMMQNFSATALTKTAGPLLIARLILGARSDYLVSGKTRKLDFER